MKKLGVILFVILSVGLTSCSSENKNDKNNDTIVDTSMNASPGLDTNGIGTDTSLSDTTRLKSSGNGTRQ